MTELGIVIMARTVPSLQAEQIAGKRIGQTLHAHNMWRETLFAQDPNVWHHQVNFAQLCQIKWPIMGTKNGISDA